MHGSLRQFPACYPGRTCRGQCSSSHIPRMEIAASAEQRWQCCSSVACLFQQLNQCPKCEDGRPGFNGFRTCAIQSKNSHRKVVFLRTLFQLFHRFSNRKSPAGFDFKINILDVDDVSALGTCTGAGGVFVSILFQEVSHHSLRCIAPMLAMICHPITSKISCPTS